MHTSNTTTQVGQEIEPMKSTIYERVMRRLLQESSSTTSLAVAVREKGQWKNAVIYDTAALRPIAREFLQRRAEARNSDVYDIVETAGERAIVGIIGIKPAAGPCWGAWEVKEAAAPSGPDAARITYGIGYALADSGILIPDRSNVSQDAQDAWMRIFMGKKRRALPLDNIAAPKTSDPQDDCRLYGRDPSNYPQLQNAYESQGWESAELTRLTAAHDAFMSEFSGKTEKADILELISRGEDALWTHAYPGAGPQ